MKYIDDALVTSGMAIRRPSAIQPMVHRGLMVKKTLKYMPLDGTLVALGGYVRETSYQRRKHQPRRLSLHDIRAGFGDSILLLLLI